MKKQFLILPLLILAASCFGAGLTVSSLNGVATNLTRYGACTNFAIPQPSGGSTNVEAIDSTGKETAIPLSTFGLANTNAISYTFYNTNLPAGMVVTNGNTVGIGTNQFGGSGGTSYTFYNTNLPAGAVITNGAIVWIGTNQPVATSSTLGISKPDGTTITISAGVLSASLQTSLTNGLKSAAFASTNVFLGTNFLLTLTSSGADSFSVDTTGKGTLTINTNALQYVNGSTGILGLITGSQISTNLNSVVTTNGVSASGQVPTSSSANGTWTWQAQSGGSGTNVTAAFLNATNTAPANFIMSDANSNLTQITVGGTFGNVDIPTNTLGTHGYSGSMSNGLFYPSGVY